MPRWEFGGRERPRKQKALRLIAAAGAQSFEPTGPLDPLGGYTLITIVWVSDRIAFAHELENRHRMQQRPWPEHWKIVCFRRACVTGGSWD